MADDVLVNKAATIERCVKRAREEYERDAAGFAADFTRQDAAILKTHLDEFLQYSQALLRRDAAR
jgi:hypothetical protein